MRGGDEGEKVEGAFNGGEVGGWVHGCRDWSGVGSSGDWMWPAFVSLVLRRERRTQWGGGIEDLKFRNRLTISPILTSAVTCNFLLSSGVTPLISHF